MAKRRDHMQFTDEDGRPCPPSSSESLGVSGNAPTAAGELRFFTACGVPILGTPAPRTGFDHVRRGLGYEPETAKHIPRWWAFYTDGRLFAACQYSSPWAEMPKRVAACPLSLVEALSRAMHEGVFGGHDTEHLLCDLEELRDHIEKRERA